MCVEDCQEIASRSLGEQEAAGFDSLLYAAMADRLQLDSVDSQPVLVVPEDLG